MSSRESMLSKVLGSPIWVWAIVLLVVFAVEIVVMLALSLFEPGSISKTFEALINAILLTLICAPVLWIVIIAPLRRIAFRELERSETVVSNAGEGILTFAQDGTILSCNHAGAELFSIAAAELIGQQIHRIIPELSWAREAGAKTIRTSGFTPTNGRFPIQVSISSLPAERCWIAIIRDLTEAEKSEKNRIENARETEAMRAQQMAILAQLATGVAHEIRNPLTSIKMMIQVNRDRLSQTGFPTEDLELVEQEIRRMERSVSSLLDYARPEKAEFTEFSLQEVIEKTVRLVAGKCEAQNVAWKVSQPEQPLIIQGDPAQIQQLLLNLCLNGLDEMPDGGTLSLHAIVADGEACITVADTGRGIDDAMIDRLFTPFATNKSNGVGLGLGICKRIADSHGGRIAGTNGESGGARFTVGLPLSTNTDTNTQ